MNLEAIAAVFDNIGIHESRDDTFTQQRFAHTLRKKRG